MAIIPAKLRTPALAVALLVAPLLVVFLAARAFHWVPSWQEFGSKFLLGWLALVFLLTTLASILWTACQTSFSRAFLGFALFVDAAAILILCVCIAYISFLDVLCLYALLAAWVALWCSVTLVLSRIGPALAAAITIALSSICFAAPVTAIPLVRGTAAREAALDALSYATPILPAFDLLKTSLPTPSWPEWTTMYRLSPIAQEIALRSHWHVAARIYAVIAILLAALALLTRRPGASNW